MKHWRLLLVPLLAACALLGSGIGRPQESLADNQVLPGHDLFQVSGGTVSWSDFSSTPIPAGFFDTGSDPFSGSMPMQGQPLNTGSDGLADTILQRMGPVNVPGPPFPSGGSVPIELVALNLVSTQPIIVNYNNVYSEPWTVTIHLSTNAVSQGTMNITRQNTNGGIFSSTLQVQPALTFTRVLDGVTKTLDYPMTGRSPVLVAANSVPWTFGPCTVLTPTPDSNFCPGVSGSTRIPFPMSGPHVSGTWQLASVSPPDFSIVCSPLSIAVMQGNSGSSSCTVQSIGGFSSSISMDCDGLPVASICNWGPNPVTPPAGGMTSLGLSIPVTNVLAGTYGFQITASSGAISHSYSAELVVSSNGGADADMDGIPDMLDNCPNLPNPGQGQPSWAVSSDSDCDGFTGTLEASIGTMPATACASTPVADDESGADAWPLDFDDNQIVNIVDLSFYVGTINATPPGPPYSARLDFDANSTINIVDLSYFVGNINAVCAPRAIINSPSPGAYVCGIAGLYGDSANPTFPSSDATNTWAYSLDGTNYTPIPDDPISPAGFGFGYPTEYWDTSSLPSGTAYVRLTETTGNFSNSTVETVQVDRAPQNGPMQFSYDSGSGNTTLSAPSATDPDGMITSYLWTFGDGTTGTGAMLTHHYVTGDYAVSLTTTDNHNCTTTTTQDLNVPTMVSAPVNYCDPLSLVVNHAGNSTSNTWPADPADATRPAGTWALGGHHSATYAVDFALEVDARVIGDPDLCTEGQYAQITYWVQLQTGTKCMLKFPPDKPGVPGGVGGANVWADGYQHPGGKTKVHNAGQITWLDAPRISMNQNLSNCVNTRTPIVAAVLQFDGFDFISGNEAPIDHAEDEGPGETAYAKYQICVRWDNTGITQKYTDEGSAQPDANAPMLTKINGTPNFSAWGGTKAALPTCT